MSRAPQSLLALALGVAVSIGAADSATARPAADRRPSAASGGIAISNTSVYDAASRSCDMRWSYQDNTGKSVRGYMVNLSSSPLKTGKTLPGGVIIMPAPDGSYPVNDLPAGGASYFYVQAVFTDGKHSSIYSSSRTC